jgi:hypothetical protein
LLVIAHQCNEEPTISFEDYLDTVNAQTNSVRPGWYDSLDNFEKLPGTHVSDLYLYRNGSRCTRHHSQPNTVRNLASCRFKYIDDIDESRLPRRLTHTVCLCERPRLHSNSHKCKSVITYVKVFRKAGCNYVWYWEPVPVACIAVSVSSVEANVQSSTRIAIEE